METQFIFYFKSNKQHKGFCSAEPPIHSLLEKLSGYKLNATSDKIPIIYSIYQTKHASNSNSICRVDEDANEKINSSLFERLDLFVCKNWSEKDQKCIIKIFETDKEMDIEKQLQLFKKAQSLLPSNKEIVNSFVSNSRIIEFEADELIHSEFVLVKKDMFSDGCLFEQLKDKETKIKQKYIKKEEYRQFYPYYSFIMRLFYFYNDKNPNYNDLLIWCNHLNDS